MSERDTMLAHALQELQQLVTVGLEPTELESPDARRTLLSIGGQLTPMDIWRARTHQVDTVGSLLAAAARWGGEGVIFHNHARAVLVCDDTTDHRLGTVTLDLPQTCPFTTLCELSQGQPRWYQHKEFLQLLKIELAGVLPEGLIPQLRQLKVLGSGSKESEIHPGRERGTQEFARELQQAEQVPESVLAQCKVYTTPDLDTTVRVQCVLDVDLDRLTFCLRPLPDSVQEAVHDAQRVLHEALQPTDLPIFQGMV